MPYPRAELFKPNSFQRDLLIAAFQKKIIVAETAQRTGKSGAIGIYHEKQCKYNPGCLGIMTVLSFKWYRRVMHSVCKELYGKQATFHGTDYVWTFPKYGNAKIAVVSAEQIDSAEGFTAAWASFDEIQEYTQNVYDVVSGRISDKRARFPSRLLCGLPEFESWPERLTRSNPEAVYFGEVGTEVNAHNILDGYVESMRETLSPEEADRRLSGKKPLPKGRVFRDFVPGFYFAGVAGNGGNLIHWEYNPELPTYVGVDFGYRRSSVVFRQKTPNFDVYFHEINLDDHSTEAMARAILEVAVPRKNAKRHDDRFLIDRIAADPAGNSYQTADGTKDMDIMRSILGTEVAYTYDRKLRSIRFGIELINSRIYSAAGKRRLLFDANMFNKGLAQGANGRSLALSVTRSKFPEDKTGKPISDEPTKDGLDDHCRDAMRYDIVNDYGAGAPFTFKAR